MYPKLIQTGDFFLPTYGLLVALGFLAAFAVVRRLAKQRGLNDEVISNLVVYCAIAGLAGAKLFMFLFDWQSYLRDPGQIFTFATLQAAGVYQGGFIVGLTYAVWYMRQHALPVWTTMDVFAPGVALGHAIGRLGCFFAGCCYGTECDRPWAVTFDVEAYKMTGVPPGVPLHPAQLYESAFNLGLFYLLYRMFQKHPRPGQVFGVYLSLYSLFRFGVEFVRHHEQELTGGLSNTQWISLATCAIGAWIYWRSMTEAPRESSEVNLTATSGK